VLLTDLPTHSQVLTPDVALLAPPEPRGFARAMLRLLEDRELQARLGDAGRCFVERNHTYDAHQRRVERLYTGLADAAAQQPEPAR